MNSEVGRRVIGGNKIVSAHFFDIGRFFGQENLQSPSSLKQSPLTLLGPGSPNYFWLVFYYMGFYNTTCLHEQLLVNYVAVASLPQ